jgi:hypothetical protein
MSSAISSSSGRTGSSPSISGLVDCESSSLNPATLKQPHNHMGGSAVSAATDRAAHRIHFDDVPDNDPILPVVDRPPVITRRRTDGFGGGSSTISSKSTEKTPGCCLIHSPTDIPLAISTKPLGLSNQGTTTSDFHTGGGENEIVRTKSNANKMWHVRMGDDRTSHPQTVSNAYHTMDASRAGYSHSPALTHLTMNEVNDYQMDLVVRDVNQRLMDDSKLFSNTTPQVLPNFDRHGTCDIVGLEPPWLGAFFALLFSSFVVILYLLYV